MKPFENSGSRQELTFFVNTSGLVLWLYLKCKTRIYINTGETNSFLHRFTFFNSFDKWRAEKFEKNFSKVATLKQLTRRRRTLENELWAQNVAFFLKDWWTSKVASLNLCKFSNGRLAKMSHILLQWPKKRETENLYEAVEHDLNGLKWGHKLGLFD